MRCMSPMHSSRMIPSGRKLWVLCSKRMVIRMLGKSHRLKKDAHYHILADFPFILIYPGSETRNGSRDPTKKISIYTKDDSKGIHSWPRVTGRVSPVN